jgi:serine/threonine protein kinase
MSGLWEHFQREQGQSSENDLGDYGTAEHDRHATLAYNDVVNAGPPARPLDFPSPEVFRGELVELRARDHKSGTIHHLKNVLLRSNTSSSKYYRSRDGCDTAYLITKKVSKTVYGSVNVCIVLKRIKKGKNNGKPEDRQDDGSDSSSVEWESTDDQAAVKISEWKKIHSMRGKHLEDPIKEIAAMQLLGNYHPHVAGVLEALQDDKCLYTVMPYLGGGDLYGRLIEFAGYRSVRSEGTGTGFDEDSARIWFRQLLQAVNLLQKKGVCHRDICLENILLDDNDNLCLIDPGMSLRVPYKDSETGGVGDVSAGTSRRLMIAQGQGGKLMYAAPEIISNEANVDAFAIDLWSVGVVLFVMVVGLAPFRMAHLSDKRYANISLGGLKSVVDGLGISISPEVCDLLQGLFWADPRKRLTLAEIIQHPWVQGRELKSRPSTLPNQSSGSYAGSNKLSSFGSLNMRNKFRGKKQSSKNSYTGSRGKHHIRPSSSSADLNQHYLHLLQS